MLQGTALKFNDMPKLLMPLRVDIFHAYKVISMVAADLNYCTIRSPQGHFSIKMLSYQNRDSHYKDKTFSWLSYLYNGNPQTWKGHLETGPWYWLCKIGRTLPFMSKDFNHLWHFNVKNEAKCKYLMLSENKKSACQVKKKLIIINYLSFNNSTNGRVSHLILIWHVTGHHGDQW